MISIVLILGASLGGDWSQFRGPDSDGIVKKSAAPLEWSDTKNVVWKVPIAGLGWSSPVVAEGRVYLTTAVPQGAGLSLRTLALDSKTGNVIWDREIFAVDQAPSIHAKNSHASPTPILRGEALFVHFGTLGTARLDATDGSVKWAMRELIYNPVHGSGGSPVLHEGKLVVICDGSSNPFVAAIDTETGKIAWKTPRSVEAKISHSFATPIVWPVNGKPQVFAPGPNHFAAYDLATGEECWRSLAPGWSVVPQPVIGHGLVIYNHDYDNPELIAIKLGGTGDVTDSGIAWRIKRGAPSTPTPLLVGDELYFVSDKGIGSCIDAKSGELHWTERLGGNYSASPVLASGRILFMNEDGGSMWIKPGRTFEILAKNEVPERTFATPAFAEDAMVLRTDQHLYKIAE